MEMRLGPQNFACYAAALTLLLSLYVLLALQPLFVLRDGRLCALRTIGLALLLGVLTGAAAYGIGHCMLKCCP